MVCGLLCATSRYSHRNPPHTFPNVYGLILCYTARTSSYGYGKDTKLRRNWRCVPKVTVDSCELQLEAIPVGLMALSHQSLYGISSYLQLNFLLKTNSLIYLRHRRHNKFSEKMEDWGKNDKLATYAAVLTKFPFYFRKWIYKIYLKMGIGVWSAIQPLSRLGTLLGPMHQLRLKAGKGVSKKV